MATESHGQGSTLPFTDRMRQISKSAHRMSDALVMARLAIACTDEMLYARSLAAFWHIHKAISEALERHKNGAGLERIAQVSKRVDRTPAFEDDLRFFLGDNWKQRVGVPTAPVRAYLDRLSEVSKGEPVKLAAHAYTQQMALLSGGQRISKLISSTMPKVDEDGTEGVTVFAFSEPVSKLKEDYRDAMNNSDLVWSEEQAQQVLEEHVRVFELNNRIIRSIAVKPRHTWQAVHRLLPPELLLCVYACIFAFVMLGLTRTFLSLTGAGDSAAGADFADTVADVEGHPMGSHGNEELK